MESVSEKTLCAVNIGLTVLVLILVVFKLFVVENFIGAALDNKGVGIHGYNAGLTSGATMRFTGTDFSQPSLGTKTTVDAAEMNNTWAQHNQESMVGYRATPNLWEISSVLEDSRSDTKSLMENLVPGSPAYKDEETKLMALLHGQ